MANDKLATDLKDEAKAAKQAAKDAEKAVADAETLLAALQSEANADIVVLLNDLISSSIAADKDIMDLLEAMYPDQNSTTLTAHLNSVTPNLVASLLNSYKVLYG